MRFKQMLVFTAPVLVLAWGQQSNTRRETPAQNVQPRLDATFQAAMKLEPASRDAALRTLVMTGNEEVATSSITALIRLQAAHTEELALQLIPRLGDMNTRHLLATAERTRDFHLRAPLARAVLNRIADDPNLSAAPRIEETGWGTAGLAATLIADVPMPSDRQLLSRVVRLRSHDPGVWLAIAKVGFANADDLALASSVMHDTGAPRWARLAAAAAMAPADPSAREFVISAITTMLTTFGQRSAESILDDAFRTKPGSQDLAKAAELQPGLLMIGILEYMQTPDAEQLTFEFLNANNLWVRTGLGLLAATRWPNRFLDTPPLHPDEYTKIRAALSILHPDLLPRVQALESPSDLEKWRSRMLNDGIETAFSLPGNAGLVF